MITDETKPITLKRAAEYLDLSYYAMYGRIDRTQSEVPPLGKIRAKQWQRKWYVTVSDIKAALNRAKPDEPPDDFLSGIH